MSEVYVNSPEADRTVYISIPVTPITGSLNVYLKGDDGKLLHTFQTVTYDNELYSVVVPYAYTESERLMTVEWNFDYTEDEILYSAIRDVQFNVVQPILTVSEIKAILTDATDEEAKDVEKMVRHIIYAHTGQSFGLFQGTKAVQGNGKYTLELPARLLEIENVNGLTVSNDLYSISGSGWYLTIPYMGIPGVKADYYGLHWINGHVENPNGVTMTGFNRSVQYIIDGKWGWYAVPEAVKEAAKLLVNDYACQDSIYRDRYLEMVAATDWRLQFHSGAFQQTGNIRADQLLSNYVLKRGWAVV